MAIGHNGAILTGGSGASWSAAGTGFPNSLIPLLPGGAIPSPGSGGTLLSLVGAGGGGCRLGNGGNGSGTVSSDQPGQYGGGGRSALSGLTKGGLGTSGAVVFIVS